MLSALLSVSVLWAVGEASASSERLRSTQLPRLEYRNVAADSVFQSLGDISREHDPEGHGVNIIYNGPTGEDAPRITLNLRRVSLYDAIRYIATVAGLHYRVDQNAVIISDRPFDSERIETRFYPVPPNFPDILRGREE